MTDGAISIGIASYKAPEKLRRTIDLVRQHSRLDYRLFIVHNPSEGDDATRRVIEETEADMADGRCVVIWMEQNAGYAGAVNAYLRRAGTEPGWGALAYLDNDAYVQTPGWDEILAGYIERHPEIGIVFPNWGPYAMPHASGYHEVMWGVGFAWAMSRKAYTSAGGMNESIGHQNECDLALRVRMAGYTLACAPEVIVQHDATASSDPAARERINRGVIQFVDHWNRYFNGIGFGYHHPQVTRWEDWPPNALYLERYRKAVGQLPGLNDNPEVVVLDGQRYDLIRVPRYENFYRGRII